MKPWRSELDILYNQGRLELQFGHGGEAVEITKPPGGRPGARGRLQFGHGGEAVEMFALTPGTPLATGFNSATAVKPWRCDDETATLLNISGLQFGHGGEAVEIGNFEITTVNREVLQFGHGGEAVEIFPSRFRKQA